MEKTYTTEPHMLAVWERIKKRATSEILKLAVPSHARDATRIHHNPLIAQSHIPYLSRGAHIIR